MSEKNPTELKAAIEIMRRDACASLRPFSVKAWHLPQIERVGAWLDKMATRVDPTVNLQAILAKLLHDEPLTYKEIRNIPYILHDEACSMELLPKAIKLLPLTKARNCHRLLCAYVWNYDASEKTRAIGKVLRMALRRSPPPEHQHFLCHAAAQPDLFFGAKSTKLMAELLYTKETVAEWMKALSLPQTLKGGSFLLRVLQTYYENPAFSLKKQYALFQETQAEDAYRTLLPTAASCLIPKADAAEPKQKAAWKKTLLDDFFRRLGDLRFPDNRVKWHTVSEPAKKIFLRWLIEQDMDLFFEIIRRTAVDRHWSSRKKFWQKYLPYIRNTRVFFGKDAIRHARRMAIKEQSLSFGTLLGGQSDHSVFAFTLGNYVFIEWSHNGMLRVWDRKFSPPVFEENYLKRETIVNYPCEEEWRHAGNDTNRWQNRVDLWIDENCILN